MFSRTRKKYFTIVAVALAAAFVVDAAHVNFARKEAAYEEAMSKKLVVLSDEVFRPSFEAKDIKEKLLSAGYAPNVTYATSDEVKAILSDETKAKKFDVVFTRRIQSPDWQPLFNTVPVMLIDTKEADALSTRRQQGKKVPVLDVSVLAANAATNKTTISVPSEDERAKDWVSSLIIAGVVPETPEAGIGKSKFASASSLKRNSGEETAIQDWQASHTKGTLLLTTEAEAVQAQAKYAYLDSFTAVRYGAVPNNEKGSTFLKHLSETAVKKPFAEDSGMRYGDVFPASGENVDWGGDRPSEAGLSKWASLLRQKN